MTHVARCNLDGALSQDLGSDYPEVWVTAQVAIDAASLASWIAGPGSSGLLAVTDSGLSTVQWAQVAFDSAKWVDPSTLGKAGTVVARVWQTVEIHNDGAAAELYVGGTLVLTHDPSGQTNRWVLVNTGYTGQDPSRFYIRDVKVGTTRGADDVASLGFDSGDLSAWGFTSGDVTVVDDPFVPPALVVAVAPGTDPGAFTDAATLATTNSSRRSKFNGFAGGLQSQMVTVQIRQTEPSARTEIHGVELDVIPLPPGLEGDG